MSIIRVIERFGLWLAFIVGGVALLLQAVSGEWKTLVQLLGWVSVGVGAFGLLLDPVGWFHRPKERVVVDRTPVELAALYKGRFGYQADADAKPYLGKWMRYSGNVRDLGPDARGRWLLWPKEVSPAVALYFKKKWKDQLQMMKPGQRFSAVGRIDSISSAMIRLGDAELVEAQAEPEPVPVANVEPSVPRPAASPTSAPEPALTVQMPTDPTPGRVFIDVSPDTLVEPFDQHTTVQAQQLVAAYKGKWMRVAGKVRDVSQTNDKRWRVMPELDFLRTQKVHSLGLYFAAKWKDHISVLRRGDRFVVDGKVTEIESFGLILEECELVGVAPPPDFEPPPVRTEPSDRDQRLDRTKAMFEARLAYVIAWHRKANNWRALKKIRVDLEAQHPEDMPDVVLADEPEWRDYIATEKRALVEVHGGRPRSFEERVQEIEKAAAAVDRLMDTIRLSEITF